VGLAVGLRVVGFDVGLRVVGFDVGLRVVGFDVGLCIVGFDVGLRVVGLAVVGELVGLRVGMASNLVTRETFAGTTTLGWPGYCHAMAKLSSPPPSFMRAS
jgi:RNase H-fold protein (predicted Holliday junction resolvase)